MTKTTSITQQRGVLDGISYFRVAVSLQSLFIIHYFGFKDWRAANDPFYYLLNTVIQICLMCTMALDIARGASGVLFGLFTILSPAWLFMGSTESNPPSPNWLPTIINFIPACICIASSVSWYPAPQLEDQDKPVELKLGDTIKVKDGPIELNDAKV